MREDDHQLGPLLTGFLPIADEGCRILILGSMPGEASLEVRQYYGHPRNHFWRLLYALLDGGEPEPSYEARTRFALSRGVALWDVLRACVRKGSLDTAIRRPEANDFEHFYQRYPQIRFIFFNGSASEQLYRRHVKPLLRKDTGRLYTLLPSSSPARALSLSAKLEAWQPLRHTWLSDDGYG
ncbi:MULTISPECIES: DNA-deoxyinosine glycosylase [unclassified Paenibacillus]|uniref:DNA-deoxyinosine glycosylase n=1 Tax=unclassified Paenibacillus TaxID=185978 RepID=UPI001AE9C641|nr:MULTISPECIES: DNA-deoxyinosine glycosylase [unclassified Paenibacillus]MBP1153397.1 hypoxanthine-DNA glycosylase [Paenibacillus sp. PvP091]MBP1171220.1 hypoxanthine-DNA glycosylase [Paenibacillus sp. PvR098]MBP2442248.1 hypoxanthine-DNA glycosylase [Paenibacillus sp. PvP052]